MKVKERLDIWFYIMFCIINTMKKHILLYHVRTHDAKKILILTCPPSSLFVSRAMRYMNQRKCFLFSSPSERIKYCLYF